MENTFKNIFKHFHKLYFLIRHIKNVNNLKYNKLINGYLDNYGDELSLLIENSGKVPQRNIIYDISIGDNNIEKKGFCAILFWTIWYIWFAEKMHFIPNVFWGKGCIYYDPEMDKTTENIFEYYFKPINNIDRSVINQEYPICICNQKHISHIGYNLSAYYNFTEDIVTIHSEMYKKYFRLNSRTQQYITNELTKICMNEKILGIHVRGTDFKKGLTDHPFIISFNEYLNKAKELFASGKYDKIFLATDDIEALDLFKNEFKDSMVYYSETFRTYGDRGTHYAKNIRPLHNYKLGLEVLRDVYTLANCDGLVCGLSHVSFAARCISLSLNHEYEDVIILDNGINNSYPKSSKNS